LNQVRNDIILSGTNALGIEKVIGVDGIRLILLKHCMADVVPSIVRILSRSFETAVFPANMKKSRVIPVFESGDRTVPNNYRPISVSKIMEKIVFKMLTGFLSANNSLFSKQYGLVSGSSTECALFELISDIQCSLDQRLRTVGVFF
jgi:hypothetical protein